MTADYPLDEVPATPKYVLAVLQDTVSLEFDDELIFDTSLLELAFSFENSGWLRTRALARNLNSTFAVNIPLSEWEAAFPNLRRRTVREVCEFLAARITRPMIRPWRHIAGECHPAGAFLTVRSLLAREGVNPAETIPSAAFGPHLRQLYIQGKAWDVLRKLMRAAPGRLPHANLNYGPLGSGGGAVGFAIVAIMLGCLSAAVGAPGLGGALLGFACLLMPVAFLIGFLSGLRPPRDVDLHGLHTFRDLAYALSGQQPRPRIKPLHEPD
jgi:hypothetical protein